MLNSITAVDDVGLTSDGVERLQLLVNGPVKLHVGNPIDSAELIERIGDAQGILVSWRTPITEQVMAACPRLRYIGLCASLRDAASSNIDLAAAQRRGIEIRGVRDYGDHGMVEFIVSQLIAVYGGHGREPWLGEPSELGGRRVGIIGLGATGTMLAERLLVLGTDVRYFSRTRRRSLESERLRFSPLLSLLSNVDVVSVHLPRGVRLMGEEEFGLLQPKTVLVDTSLGETFDVDAFASWISRPDALAILDSEAGKRLHPSLLQRHNVLYTNRVTGLTQEARQRLTDKVVENLASYVNVAAAPRTA